MRGREVPDELQEHLDRYEVQVTRAVTDAVTADLAARHERELAQHRSTITALEAEVEALHIEVQDVRRELTRLRSHPVIRVARVVRRLLSSRLGGSTGDVTSNV